MRSYPKVSLSESGVVRVGLWDRNEHFLSHSDFVQWLQESKESPFNRLPEAIKLADVLTADVQYLEDKLVDLEERLNKAYAMIGRMAVGEVTILDGEVITEEEGDGYGG